MAGNGGKRKGAGRKKGVPNKDKRELIDLIQEKFPGWHPLIAMAEMANSKETVEISMGGEAY